MSVGAQKSFGGVSSLPDYQVQLSFILQLYASSLDEAKQVMTLSVKFYVEVG
jgi:hypothetical protein